MASAVPLAFLPKRQPLGGEHFDRLRRADIAVLDSVDDPIERLKRLIIIKPTKLWQR